MSIWNVICLSQKFSRQAYILANNSRKILNPRSQKLPPVNVTSRCYAHNSLYYMVKKRTLEARTKLQANKYPNHQACLTSNNVPCPAISDDDCCDSPTAFATSQKPNHTSKKSEPHDVCENTHLLKASTRSLSSCDSKAAAEKRKSQQDSCENFMQKHGDKTGGLGGRDGKDCDDGKSSLNWKYLLALLAALGAGGLIAWLLLRNNKSKDDEDEALKRAKQAGLITTPPSSSDLPKHVPYLLIGGGTAAFSAFRAIKSNDAKAKVLMISDEFRKPYMRPPLSKELWYTQPDKNDKGEEVTSTNYRFKQWTGAERSLYFEPNEFFMDPTKLASSANGGIAVAEGFAVKKIDAASRTVTLMDDYEITYDECLIATGCTPKNLVIFRDASPSVREKVMVYRTPQDYDRLRRYAREKRNITIVGNGFIGSELACSLAHYSKQNCGGKVHQIFQEDGNMSKVLPKYLSQWTMKKMEALGVCVIPNASIKDAQRDEQKLKLELNNGSSLLTDIVVVCVGCSPNTQLASASSLEVDRSLGGFVVNAELEARRNLYAAGDASCFYDPLLGRRRVEHHDHSVVSGRLAGENMTGKKKPYTHQSMFWSDLGPEIGYEGIGLVDSSLPTVGVFALPSNTERSGDNLTEDRKETTCKVETKKCSSPSDVQSEDGDPNYGKGVIFYLKDDKIVGILLWNLFNRIGLARTIINENKKYDDLNEVAKLFEIHA